jgi:hypothetical protein
MLETDLSFGIDYPILLKIFVGLKFDASQIQGKHFSGEIDCPSKITNTA